MKKILTLILSLIFVLMFAISSFAAIYTYDQFTGELESVKRAGDEDISDEALSGKQKITAYSFYDTDDRKFYFYSENSSSSGYVTSTVCSGECTGENVTITINGDIDVAMYCDGKLQETAPFMTISDAGDYLFKDTASGKTMFEFVKLDKVSAYMFSYELPSVYFLTGCTIDGQSSYISGNTVDMTKDGSYVISYVNVYDDVNGKLSLIVDHTAPVLEIYGVENGEAHQAVSFGTLEDNSTLLVTMDGVEISLRDEYKDAGTYFVTYTDEAGNSSVYEFTIYMFLDFKAWVVIVFAFLIVIAAFAYMMYWRKHLPRS